MFMASSFRVKVDHVRHQLNFRFEAGTSRGVLKTKDTYFVRVSSESFSGVFGYGEAGPLPKLSIDDLPDFEERLAWICRKVSEIPVPLSEPEILEWVNCHVPEELPSVRFALEVAMLDLVQGGKKRILENEFYDRGAPLAINGLVWMGSSDFMLGQIRQKLADGYTCIKMKIGSIDFEQEYALLADIRKHYTADQVVLRVDANGAFSVIEAREKLRRLGELDIHSIEQPIRQGQRKAMSDLAKDSPVPIALDEELIGVFGSKEKERLLDEVQPQYIILKPSLVGGIQATQEWIRVAEERGIGWWMTSALESNIGLNAIAQLTSTYCPTVPQGLGTGQLYHNNIASPLTVDAGRIFYNCDGSWGNIAGLFGAVSL